MNISLNNLIELKKLPKKYLDSLYNNLEILHNGNSLPYLIFENSNKNIKLEQLILILNKIAGYWGKEKISINLIKKFHHKGTAIINENHYKDISLMKTKKSSILILHKDNHNTTLFIEKIHPYEINKNPKFPSYEIEFSFTEECMYLGNNQLFKQKSSLSKRIKNLL